MVLDAETGQHVLKMTTKQKVGEENIEDILRLAGIIVNFHSFHKYFKFVSLSSLSLSLSLS